MFSVLVAMSDMLPERWEFFHFILPIPGNFRQILEIVKF